MGVPESQVNYFLFAQTDIRHLALSLDCAAKHSIEPFERKWLESLVKDCKQIEEYIEKGLGKEVTDGRESVDAEGNTESAGHQRKDAGPND